MRKSEIRRQTGETDVCVQLNIDGSGKADIDTEVPFLDHMLTLFAHHGRFDLTVKCHTDDNFDDHHSVEDIGITLGRAFCEAAGDKAGITRYASLFLPMDEALALIAIDISGRAALVFDESFRSQKVGEFDTELVEEFFCGFVRSFPMALHIKEMYGTNTHHVIEAMFKGFGRAMRTALSFDAALQGEIPSTKGVL